MSGYNAEFGIPNGDKDETPTPEPITNMPVPYNDWEFNSLLGGYKADEYLEEKDMGDLSAYDVAKLVQTVRTLQRKLNREIDADDWRLQHIWERAGEIANGRGYCDVFDTIMEELGTGYVREAEFCLTVTVTRTYDVHLNAPRNSGHYELEELIGEVLTVEDVEQNECTDVNISLENFEQQ